MSRIFVKINNFWLILAENKLNFPHTRAIYIVSDLSRKIKKIKKPLKLAIKIKGYQEVIHMYLAGKYKLQLPRHKYYINFE